MKKILLFTLISAFITMGAMAQENLISGGDFENPSSWELALFGIEEMDMEIIFGNPMFPPKYGTGNNLRIAWSEIGYFELYLYQTVSLKVGSTYEFSGAFKDVDSDEDSDFYWHQIVMMPVNDYEDIGTDMPDWGTFGGNPSLLQGMGVWNGVPDNEGGLGKDTTYTFNSKQYGGAFTGTLNQQCNQGDTTIFTIPNTYPSTTGGLELGEDGTAVDFYFILYFGQSTSGNQTNTCNFTFDEFSIIEDVTSGISNDKVGNPNDFKVYPNPVLETLKVSSNYGISSISIVNIVGQEVLNHSNILHNSVDINTSSLDKGIYLVRLTDLNGEVSSQKIIKK